MSSSLRPWSALSLPILLWLCLGIQAPARAAETPWDPAGHWEGQIELPGQALIVKIDLAREGEAWSGTIDIPAQGVGDLPLNAFRVAGDSLAFAIADIPGDPIFRGVREGDDVAGTFSQSGYDFAFRLGREEAVAAPRPQDPQRPLPYAEEEVGYESGDVHLAATLTVPQGEGPFPAAVLLTGSGAQNRDEELFGHRFFLVLADHLTRRGIAVLRADDRGVGGSTGSNSGSTTSDFADDALAGVAFLRARAEIDPQRIGLIGHSEGGIVAPMAAVRAPDEIAFVVMIAGTGVPLDQVILRQAELIARAGGEDSTAVATELASTRLLLDGVKAGADSLQLRRQLEELVAKQVAAMPDSLRPSPQEIDARIGMELRRVLNPWFRFAVSYDPRAALRKVRCPVLALDGGLDLQVDPDQNLPEIEKALREAGDDDVTILRLPGLNHMLQTARTGHPAEYGQIEETMSPRALEAISDWILARFGS